MLFAQLYKTFTDCFVLEILTVGTVSRFQNRICIIESQEKENFIYYILMKKWEQLQLTLNNSKSEEGRGDYLDNKQICSRQWEFEFLNVIFYKFCSIRRYQWDSLISGMFSIRVCMEFNFLSIQVIKSQLSLWIFKFFSSKLSNIFQK